jgi:fatty-acyl-CoA synthase
MNFMTDREPSRERDTSGSAVRKRTMMHYPLTLTSLFERAGKLYPEVEIVSRRADNSIHRYAYRDWHARTKALAAALQDCGIQPGDRVATLMWNHYAHLEAYFAIPIIGGVLHTLNLRLHPDELTYVIEDAEDRFLIIDDVLLPLYEKIRHRVNLERVIVVPFSGKPVPLDYVDYELLLRRSSSNPEYADLDEDDAISMCYTSGTTGKPKGVVYSHRALALHSYSISLPDNFSISRNDTILPAASMFHANGWGLHATASSRQSGSGVFRTGFERQSVSPIRKKSGYSTAWKGWIPNRASVLQEPAKAQKPHPWRRSQLE